MGICQYEKNGDQLYGLEPFDSSKGITKLKSWDAEATEEEKLATRHLVEKIQSLQSKPKKELSGVQIMCHFLRLRIQPLQARSHTMWLYEGSKDGDRISEDLKPEDFDRLARQLTKLKKKDPVPTGCRVTPYGPDKKLPQVFLVSTPSSLSQLCHTNFL